MFDPNTIASTLKAVAAVQEMKDLQAKGALTKEMEHQLTQMQLANPGTTKMARRLYIGNLPVHMSPTEAQLTCFFTVASKVVGIKTPHPVVSCWLSTEGTFCFCEFRSVADANNCHNLFQGVVMGGRPLRIGRPSDWKPLPPSMQSFVLPLTTAVTEEDMKELPKDMAGLVLAAGAGGPLVASSNLDKLSAPKTTLLPTSMANLGGGMAATMAGNILGSLAPTLGLGGPDIAPSSNEPVVLHRSLVPSSVLLLLNMVSETGEELLDEDEFQDMILDVREECEQCGTVTQVVIPRPVPEGKDAAALNEGVNKTEGDIGPYGIGVGRIFVRFADPMGATKAISALNGRMFNEQEVRAMYYMVEAFEQKKYN